MPTSGAPSSELLGPNNHRLKSLRRLATSSRQRAQHGAFIVEGPMLVAEAIESSLVVTEIYHEDECAPELASKANSAAIPIFEVAADGLKAALTTVSPQPVAALVEAPTWVMADIGSGRGVLILASLRDPGNVGTLIRTAEAAGFSGVVLCGTSVDYTNPKVVRSSAGAVLRMPIVVAASLADALVPLRASGHPIVAAALDPAATPYDELDLTMAAIVVGNEAHGLSPEEVAECDVVATIPLAGATESLNVAAAGAILCFASWQQFRSQTDRRTTVLEGPQC